MSNKAKPLRQAIKSQILLSQHPVATLMQMMLKQLAGFYVKQIFKTNKIKVRIIKLKFAFSPLERNSFQLSGNFFRKIFSLKDYTKALFLFILWGRFDETCSNQPATTQLLNLVLQFLKISFTTCSLDGKRGQTGGITIE